VDSSGSGHGPLAGCCECGDEPSGSGTMELVIYGFICDHKISRCSAMIDIYLRYSLILSSNLPMGPPRGILSLRFPTKFGHLFWFAVTPVM
jgi:hypothetical protein